jgi:hypothetical protein
VYRAAAQVVEAVVAVRAEQAEQAVRAEQAEQAEQAEAVVAVPLRQRLQPIRAACMALPAACDFRDD